MKMPEISAHDFFATPFCAQCGVNDVTRHGEICNSCKWLVAEKAGPTLPEIRVRGRRELASPISSIERARGLFVGVETGLKCKWPECQNDVNSHKGLAGYCVVIQPNGKTHRQMHITEMRERDPDYGRHPSQRRGEVFKPSRVGNGKRDWLGETAAAIQEAASRVELAQEDLEEARAELEELLGNALKQVRKGA